MSRAALPTLRTPRLTLRPLHDSDAPAIVAGVGNYDVAKWLSSLPYPYGQDDAAFFIEKTMENATRVWAICEDDGLVGVIGLDPDLGYWLARPAWGKGYAFEAARKVVAHCFEDPKLDAIDSAYFVGNARSGAILQALGFQKTHLKKIEAKPRSQEVDAHAMRLTREDWEARESFVVHTDRLVIRPLRTSDAEAFMSLAVPEVARNLRQMPDGISLETARHIVADAGFKGDAEFMNAIEKDGKLIGAIEMHIDPVSVGYFLHPDWWGQGLASEALGAFLTEVFARFPINRIVADVFTDNPASATVLRKFGFVEVGRGTGVSKARLEPAPNVEYAVTRDSFKADR